MFMNDVGRKEDCKREALCSLRKFGVKFRPKKLKSQAIKKSSKVFQIPLERLISQTITLKTGQQISVPRVVHELCTKILESVDTEGLFRKGGSKKRQNEIMLLLDNGRKFDPDYTVIDLAAVLKTFLRELPEPLIPTHCHDSFLQCADLTQWQLEATLIACLLLPQDHLNTLAYLMQFLHQVADHSDKNKMNSYNLAVVMGPNILPFDSKTTPQVRNRTSQIAEIVQLLIDNYENIGLLPDDIISRVASSSSTHIESDDAQKKKTKKRRSGSITRMFKGLRNIVGSKGVEDNGHVVTPDLLMTPMNVLKKRKVQTTGISQKRKTDVLKSLPDKGLLTTPFTPMRTPVCMNVRGSPEVAEQEVTKERRWFGRSKSVKTIRQEPEKVMVRRAHERRWSSPSVAQSATVAHASEPDYIRVRKTEYEEIKSRVSAIEQRISTELHANPTPPNVERVQCAYEHTLSQSKLSPTTDQLARRLSRELKIRKSGEIIRSPSARKIGSLRRRSSERANANVKRHRSWHVPASPRTATSGSSSNAWTSAENFFTTPQSDQISNTSNCGDRASIAELRSQNAGMVLAKAKLFETDVAPLRLPRPKLTVSNERVRMLKQDERRTYRRSVSPRKCNNVHMTNKHRVHMARLHLEQGYSDKENSNVTCKRVASPLTPQIKRPMNVRSPKRLCRTPAMERSTPLRAVRSTTRS